MFCFVDDYVWTSLQVGNLDEKNTEKILGGTTFEESISLLIYDLASDKVSSGRQLQLPFFFCAYAHCCSFAKLRCKPKILEAFGPSSASTKGPRVWISSHLSPKVL